MWGIDEQTCCSERVVISFSKKPAEVFEENSLKMTPTEGTPSVCEKLQYLLSRA